MFTIIKMIHDGIELEYPTVAERVLMYYMLVAENITFHAAEVVVSNYDIIKVVPMTAHEMSWFARL